MIWGVEGRHAWTPPGGSGLSLHNPFKNPSFELNTTGWALSKTSWTVGTLTREELPFEGSSGDWIGRVLLEKDNTATERIANLSVSTENEVSPGDVCQYTLEAFFADNANGGVTPYINFFNGGELLESAKGIGATVTGTGHKTLQTGSAVAPAKTTRAEVIFKVVSTLAKDVIDMRVDALCPVLPGGYFDGDSPKGSWTGTPHASTSDLALPALTLNLLEDEDGDPVWPRYKLVEVGGLMGLGDAEEINDPKVGQTGENPRLSQRRGKTVSYVGAVQARSLRDLRLAEAALRAAFADCTRQGLMDVTPHPDNPEFLDDPPKFYEARALGVELVDVQGPPTVTTFGFERTFILGLRMADPRYFDDETLRFTATITETNSIEEFS